MKPYVVGFKRRGIEAVAVDLPKGNAERAIPVFIKTSGRGHDVIGGGQSFGGRVASMAAIEADFGGLVLFSYPLHRPGFTDQLRTEHLRSIPIVDPAAVHQIGLVVPPREPMAPLVSALIGEAIQLAKTLL